LDHHNHSAAKAAKSCH